VNRQRAENEAVVFAAIEKDKSLFAVQGPHLERAKQLIHDGDDAQVEAIALALISDPENFRGAMIKDLFNEDNLDIVSTIATVYSPDIHPGRSRHYRAQSIKTAYIQYIASDESRFPDLSRHKDIRDYEIWTISNEDEPVRNRAKRFVAMFCAIEALSPRAENDVRWRLTEIMLDDTRSDHDPIIEFLRQNNRGSVTLEQLEFVISGGPASMSGGAL
jgi:hypothetical protein